MAVDEYDPTLAPRFLDENERAPDEDARRYEIDVELRSIDRELAAFTGPAWDRLRALMGEIEAAILTSLANASTTPDLETVRMEQGKLALIAQLKSVPTGLNTRKDQLLDDLRGLSTPTEEGEIDDG